MTSNKTILQALLIFISWFERLLIRSLNSGWHSRVNLNANFDEVQNAFSCQPEHWKITDFIDRVILIKEEKLFDSFKFTCFQFCFNAFFNCCLTTSRLVTQYTRLNRNYAENYKDLFKFCSFLFPFIDWISSQELSPPI